jgi:hypothetical protein
MVRAVPRAEIDFGNGRKLVRTVNGNVATYLAMPDGGTFDIVPGVMTPAEYAERLREGLRMYRNLKTAPPEKVKALVAAYHQERARLLLLPPTPSAPPDIAKARVERPIKRAIKKPKGADSGGKDRQLEEDTAYNRRVRYPKVAALLSKRALARPDALTKVVYKTILDVDLDDPYLGLAPDRIGGEPGRL